MVVKLHTEICCPKCGSKVFYRIPRRGLMRMLPTARSHYCTWCCDEFRSALGYLAWRPGH